MVICRLYNPGSKLKTVDYLERYLHVSYDINKIYRFLDNLCYRKELVEDMKAETDKAKKIGCIGCFIRFWVYFLMAFVIALLGKMVS